MKNASLAVMAPARRTAPKGAVRVREIPGAPHILRVQRIVAQKYGITLADLFLANRGHESISWPRQVAMQLSAIAHLGNLAEIGYCFKRHHTTVMNACEAVEDLILIEPHRLGRYQHCRNAIERYFGIIVPKIELGETDSSKRSLIEQRLCIPAGSDPADYYSLAKSLTHAEAAAFLQKLAEFEEYVTAPLRAGFKKAMTITR